MIRNCTLFLTFLLLCNWANAQDGSPDPGFANNGFYKGNYGQGRITADVSIKLSNGKTLIGGYRSLGNSSDNALTRLNADGSLDVSYGINGSTVFSTSYSNDSIIQILELPNSDILVLSAGVAMSYGTEVQLSRLNANGQLDNSFGVSGKVGWNKNSTSLHNTYPQQMLRTSDGSILVLSLATVDSYRPTIVKFDADGIINTSYGVNGVFTSDITPSAFIYELPKARMHLNADQSTIIYALQPRSSGAAHDSLHLEKVLVAGTRDLSFGPNGDGVMRKYITNERVAMCDGITDSNGDIMVVMTTAIANGENYAMAYKFRPDGSAVTTFGNNGLHFISTRSGVTDIYRLTALPAAEVAFAGSVRYGSPIELSEKFFTAGIINATGSFSNFGYGVAPMISDEGFINTSGQMISNGDGTYLAIGSGYEPYSDAYSIQLCQMDPFGENTGLYYVKFNNTRNNTDAQALAVTGDGKILAGGFTFRNSKRLMMLTRLNANGTPDPSFRGGNALTLSFGTQDDVQAINPLADGKILLAGNSFNSSFEPFIFFYKLNNDGSPDLSFGTAGVLKPSTGTGMSPRCVLFQPNGKILVAGNVNGQMRVLRYNADCSPDLSFNGTGLINLGFGTSSSFLEHITVQNDGKLLVTGTGRTFINSSFGVIRLNDDGSLDNSFNGSGIHLAAPYGTSNTGRFALQQADGKIVVGGYSNVPEGTHFSIIRLNTDGSSDAGFGNGGRNYINIFNISQPSKAMLLPDGRILMAGIALSGGLNGGALAMFNADGTVHTGFGTNGYYFTTNGGEYRGLRYLSGSNRILVSGRGSVAGIADALVGSFRYTPSTLPLTWKSFTASKTNNAVALNWSTIQEINTRDFDVQSSTDGIKWKTINRTPAAGNSNTLQQYSFLHATPVNGLNQYRILQRDLDGRTSYSAIRMIWMNGTEKTFKVLNTLVSDGMIRVIMNGNDSWLRVVNSAGLLLAERKANEGMNEISVAGWPAGLYYIVCDNETEKIVIR